MASPLVSAAYCVRRASSIWRSCGPQLLRAVHGSTSIQKPFIRAIAQPSLRLRREFHASSIAQNKNRLDKERLNLETLAKQVQNASPEDKARLAPQLKEQEENFLELCMEHNKEVLKLVPIPVKDGETLQGGERLERLSNYVAARYPEEVHWGYEIVEDDLGEKLAGDLAAEYPSPDPLTKEETHAFLVAYFRIVNGMSAPKDVEFLNETIQTLYNLYNENGDLDEPLIKTDLDSQLVAQWALVFKTIHDIPQKTENSEFIKLSDLVAKLSENALETGASHQHGSQAKSAKDNKNGKDDKGDKNTLFLSFDVSKRTMQLFLLGVMGGLLMVLFYAGAESEHEITFQEFSANFLRQNLVSKIRVINNRTAIVELNENGKTRYSGPGDYYFSIGSVETFERNLKAVQKEYNIPEPLRVPVVYVNEGSMAKMLVNFLPTLLFLGAIYYMTKKASMGGMGGPMGFGKSTAKKFNQEANVKTKFKDVAGMDEAKMEVMEFVKFLQNPAKYEKLGAKIPRGAILSGPPGTGKTLIARATAGEANVPFFSVSGSEFVEMFVGVGASRVRDLFKTARENAPSIVFVDEIDAIGKQRSKGKASGANDERETTLNQLLVEMDGFDTTDHVVVLAGTNRPDILDKALLRPGRFDRHISIDNPELEGRKDIFRVHLRKIALAENIDKDLAGRLATLTPGFSGADIANVCNEAALIAARFNAKAVTLRHFELAIERVIGGVEKKSKLLGPEEKRIVAYHEAGHAVCGWFLEHAVPLLKVSIIPRGQGVLGYAQYLPADQYLMSTFDLYDRMVMTLGGRVSEELNFSSVTSGAHDDFKKVTNIAQSMVLRFGMSPKVGMVNYADTKSQESLAKPFSDHTNKIIDSEVKRIVQECHDRCKQLLTEKSNEVEIVAQELLKKEFITREDMIRLLGKRPFPEKNDAFDKYLAGNDAFKNEQPKEEKKDDE